MKIYTEIMSLHLASFIICLIVAIVTCSQGEIEKEKDEIQEELVKSETENLELSKRQGDLVQVTCVKGMAHNSPREKFLLWGKVPAVCDTETDGGGWIVIQRRTKGDVDFYRGWTDYKNGFGTPDTDFWIGNDFIHNLTSQGYTELRVDMEYQGTQYFAHYSHFDVAAETSLYHLSVSGYNGTSTAGDGLSYHNGSNFSTFDKDNDSITSSCASNYHGAWWYHSCYLSNLNGMWGAMNNSGMAWNPLVSRASVSVSEMKVRHV